VIEDVECLDPEIDAFSFPRKNLVQREIDGSVSRANDGIASEEGRPVTAPESVSIQVTTGIAGHGRRQGTPAPGLYNTVDLPPSVHVPHRRKIESMPLISPADTAFGTGSKRIIAGATQNLVAGGRASVDQSGPCVVGKKLQTMLVLLLRLDEKRVVNRVVI